MYIRWVIFFRFLNNVCLCVCAGSCGSQKTHQIPVWWSVSVWYRSWQWNASPLQDQRMLLSTEPCLQLSTSRPERKIMLIDITEEYSRGEWNLYWLCNTSITVFSKGVSSKVGCRTISRCSPTAPVSKFPPTWSWSQEGMQSCSMSDYFTGKVIWCGNSR